jgi:transcriptional regulator with XRE-family HTH domain
MVNTNNNWYAMDDAAVISAIGEYIRHERLQQNMTQEKLSTHSGINRWTLTQIEGGQAISLTNLIAILRSLKALHVFDEVMVRASVDPLERMKLVKKQRQRARNKDDKGTPESDW